MRKALAAFRRSRVASGMETATPPRSNPVQRVAGVVDAFARLFERQTGLAQAARLQELEDLVRDKQIAERVGRLKVGKP